MLAADRPTANRYFLSDVGRAEITRPAPPEPYSTLPEPARPELDGLVRLIPSHGAVIEGDAAGALREVDGRL